jgi:hypothetical protein
VLDGVLEVMLMTQNIPLPTAHGAVPPPRRFRLDRRSLVPALAFSLVIVLALVGLWIANEHAKDRAIRELPDAERKALYDHTLSTLRTVCATPHWPDGLRSYCRDQAELVVRFPECDAECRALADRYQYPAR